MGHESQIEPWLPLTTILLVSFRADGLREDAMKPAKKENRNQEWMVEPVRTHLSLRGAGSKTNSNSSRPGRRIFS